MKRLIEDHPVGFLLSIFGALIMFCFGGWILESYMEAKSYNRVTGQNVSTWDAMWIELRVQDSPRVE